MPEIPLFITQWIGQYGNLALFILLALGIIGLPIPEETLIAFAGFLVAKHQLPLILTFVTILSGAICGISVSYLLGRTIGYFLIARYGNKIGITPAKLEKVNRWFDRIGKWAIFFGYFILGIRHLTGYIAGTTKITFTHFAFFAYLGAFFWATLFFSLGYFFMSNWEVIITLVRLYVWFFLSLLILMAGIYFIWKYTQRKKRLNENYAKTDDNKI